VFPLRDDNPTVHRSLVTFLVVAANALIWILVQHLGSDPGLTESVWRFGVIPGEFTGRVEPGARVLAGKQVLAVLDGVPDPWTLLTSMFMHAGWLHLIGNMWFLLVFGDNVEDAMGPLRFILFYLLCGLAAAAAQILSDPGGTLPMVGASGAIGGIMGAYLRLYPRAPVHMLVFLGFFIDRIVVPAFLMLVYWFALQFLSGLVAGANGGVAFWAHVGGFSAGFLLAVPFSSPSRLVTCRSRRGSTTAWLARPRAGRG
jgi:membrane associated rhomboid family serine protease